MMPIFFLFCVQINTLGHKHLSKMVPGVLYPESVLAVQYLTDVPLDKNKLLKLSKSAFQDFMSANKISFSGGHSKTIS
jgi:hypothetical protein